MEIKKVGMLAVLNSKKEIVAIVYHHEPSRNQVLMICNQAGVEEYETLFNNLIQGESNVG